MKLKLHIIITISLLIAGCSKEWNFVEIDNNPVIVGFFAGNGNQTRTSINNDGINTSWSIDDKISLWAIDGEGNYTLDNQIFKIYFRDLPLSKAFFTTTLGSAMKEGNYHYYATYPTPKEVNGTKATFTLPATQDGMISSGAAIMVATPAQGSQLGILTDAANNHNSNETNNRLSLQMSHVTHALKFFIPSDKWGFAEGEKVERIDVTMPQNIAGDVTLDYTNPASAVTTANGVKTIIMNLKNPIGASTSAANIDFAAAAIIPTTVFNDGDLMEVKAFSATKASRYYISLKDREAMQAGHITPVAVDCSEVFGRHSIRFIWGGNNLGEDVQTITFKTTAGNEIYKITNVADFEKSGRHEIDFTFEDKSLLATIANKEITVEYESEHAIVSETIKMPADIGTSLKCHEIKLVVPYLFFEDFSLLKGYDINGGNVSTKRQGGKNINDTFFYSGWTGEQTSGKAGTAIRIRTRNETTWAFYNGRVDSAPISGLKSGASVKVSVSFDYNAVTEESGDNCMSFSYGYTTKQGPITAYWWYKPLFGSQTGGEHIENAKTVSLPSNSNMTSFNNDVYPSSYYKIEDFEINGCTNKHRLSWEPLASGSTNHLANSTNHWLYIDNIKVKIVQ